MNLKMQARITWYSRGFYCENYHCVVLRLYDQFMTHHISRGFESDASWAKKRGGKRWNIGKCCPKVDPFAKINGRWRCLGTGRREGQIRKPVRKKAGLLWKLLEFKTWKRIFATWRQSLYTWLTKFIMELCKDTGETYPPRKLYRICSGIQRHLENCNY